MKPNIEDVKNRLADMESHFLFDYDGKRCGVDPISRNKYNLWFGEKHSYVTSAEAVFEVPFWGGKRLPEIYDTITINAY